MTYLGIDDRGSDIFNRFEITWILKEDYINGAAFSMGGKRVLMEYVVAPPKDSPPGEDRKFEIDPKEKPSSDAETGKVISLFDRK